MARPIEATPVLRRREAVRFIRALNNPKPVKEPVFDLKAMQLAAKDILDRTNNVQK